MKPYGMTPLFRVVKPSQTEDAVWDAVETALAEGWTPEQFMAEVREAWPGVLEEQARQARAALAKEPGRG